MRFHGPDEPVYIISVASRLLGISPHVLRMLERQGLLTPARTEKNIRLYSENDLIKVRYICRLIKEEGINIAGVKAILRMETSSSSVTMSVWNECGEDKGDAERRSGNAENDRQNTSRRPDRNGWY